MNVKTLIKQVLGLIGIVVGCAFAFLVLRALIVGHIANAWMVANDLLISFTSAYLIYRGVLALRDSNYSRRAGFKFGWGRMLLGSWLIFSNLYGRSHPAPNLLLPSNETQAMAMKATATMILSGAVCLIVWGVANGFRHRKQTQGPSNSLGVTE